MMQPLGSVCEIIMGQAPAGDTYNDDQVGLPLIAGASDFGEITPKPTRFTTAAAKISRANDIIVCVRATIGDLNWSDGDYCLGRGVAALRVNERKADRNYIWRAVEHGAGRLSSLGRGATFKQISKPDIADFEIPLPPLEEQKRIAAILDQADELRRKRQRALDRLNQLGQALFIEMFGDPVANPFGFPMRKLGELGDLDRGISKHRPRNDPALLNGVHPLIQTGDVANADGYIRHFSSTYSDLGLQQSRKWPVGTLCITIAANIGKTAILEIEACFPDSVVGFTPGDATNAEYVQFWMERIQKRLEEIAPQSAQKNINLAILRELPIPVPPIEMQDTFAGRVKALEAQKAELRASDRQFGRLFASLQHRAFRGDLTASSLKEAAA